jgi:hypothetical protein
MSIFTDFFNKGASQPVTPGAPMGAAQNPTIPTPGQGTNAAVDPAATQGNPAAIPAAATGPASPLDSYKGMWDTKAADPAAMAGVSLNLDATKIGEAAKNLDFTKSINPEQLAAATKGDPTALAAIISQAGQAGFTQSIAVTGKIVEAALAKQAEQFQAAIPGMLRQQTLQTQAPANSVLTDPAVQPLVATVTSQMAAKYPQATPSEIGKHVNDFFTSFATSMVQGSGRTVQEAPTGRSAPPKEVDWSQWITS